MSSPEIVIVTVVYEDKILCVQRSYEDRQFPGYWEFPGGKVELNETLIDAAIRELKEETGIVVNDLTYLGDLNNKVNNHIKILHLFVIQLDCQPQIQLNFREHHAYQWIPLTYQQFDDSWLKNVEPGVVLINEWRK